MISFMNRWLCKNRITSRCESIPGDPSVCLRFRCPHLQDAENGPDNVSRFQCLQHLEGDRCYPKWDNIRDFLGKEDKVLKPNSPLKRNRPKFSLWKAVLSLFSL